MMGEDTGGLVLVARVQVNQKETAWDFCPVEFLKQVIKYSKGGNFTQTSSEMLSFFFFFH